jgi:hypothetical protein
VGTPLIPLIAITVVAACSVWVLRDAQALAGRRRPVVVVLFGFTIAEPSTWAVLCLVGSIAFLPMYLVARNNS